MAGGQPDFQGFMDKYGDLFGPNPPQSLEELIEQMQQQAAAMQALMDGLQGLDDLEKQLERTQYGGNLDEIDEEKLRDLLGEEAYQTLKQLKDFLEILEEAGYIRP